MRKIGPFGRHGRLRTLLLLVAVLAISVAGIAVGKNGKPAKPTSGVVYAGVTHLEGDDLYVAGEFNDELLGRGAIVYVTQPTGGDEPGSVLVTARKITIYTKKGSLSGSGEAIQGPLQPDGTATISDGTFKLKKGTGKYKGHKFKGTFDGGYAEGVYTFNYVGTFK